MGDLAAVDRHHNGPPDGERIEDAGPLCRGPAMPSERAVLTWAATRPEFRRQYDFAREVGREAIGHDVLAIADGMFRSPDEIKDARRKIDALKWHHGRMTPKRRGNRAAGN